MTSERLLLAIDTSTRQAGVALFAESRGLLAEYNWHSANRHTEELLPAVDLLLGSAGATGADLAVVGVALGPGSFSGLRVGLAAAKGLALASGIPLVGVPTLDVTAYPHQAQPVHVVAIAQAGRGRVYFAPYAHGPAGWGPQAPYALGTLLDIANLTFRPTAFVGELTATDRETLSQFVGKQRAVFLPASQNLRRAGHLAELAWRRFATGEADDPASLSPLYLQQPEGARPDGLPGSATS